MADVQCIGKVPKRLKVSNHLPMNRVPGQSAFGVTNESFEVMNEN